jgi:hypothetical protein
MMAKKTSQKRDVVKTKGRARYAKRTASGEFREMDDVGRSQKADRRTKARKAVKSGYGDQGDQKRKGTKKKAAKKR